MKTKRKTYVAAAAATIATSAATAVTVSREKMKSVILYPYGPLTTTGCCRMLHAKNLAITSAIYTINISLLIVLIYSWRINVNIRKSDELEDVYYGVQIAYFAIIGTQMSMIALSVMLIVGIYKENPGLIVPWIIGYITFMALEAVAMVYSNVLRDHVNKQFDALCKVEVAFFIARAFINVLAMWGVMRFYNLVRAGITWKGPEVIELKYNGHDDKSVVSRLASSQTYHISPYHMQAKTTLTSAYHYHNDSNCEASGHGGFSNCHGYFKQEERKPITTGCCFFDFDVYDEEGDEYDCNEDEEYDEYEEYFDHVVAPTSNKRHRNNNIRSVLINKRHNKYKITHQQTRLAVIDESERSAGSGSDENDSLLVAIDSTASV